MVCGQVRSRPDIAVSMLAEHDALVAEGGLPHRVTSLFCQECGQDSLREDFQAFSTGSPMSRRLSLEVRAYEVVKLDDTWAEGSHAAVSRAARIRAAWSIAGMLAQHRLNQHMLDMDRFGVRRRERLQSLFARWRAIGQVDPVSASRWVAPRKDRSAVMDFVYRAGETGLKPWTDVFKGFPLPARGEQKGKKATPFLKLQVEYLRSLLRDGQVLSISEAASSAGQGQCHADSDGVGAAKHSFLTVVSTHAARKKRVSAASERAAYKLPINIQRHSAHHGPAGSCQAQVRLAYEGVPETVDFLSLAPWPALRSCLYRWEQQPSPLQGCIGVSRPVKLEPLSDWTSAETPCLTLLRELADTAWTYGQPAGPHTLTSPRRFLVPDPVSRKSYVRCLAGLAALVTDRGLLELPHDQVSSYYDCVLSAEDPRSVPVGKDHAAYIAILKPLGQPGQDRDSEHEGDADEDAQPEGEFGRAKAGVCIVECASQRKRRAPTTRSSSTTAAQRWTSLVWEEGSQASAPEPLGVLTDAGQEVAASAEPIGQELAGQLAEAAAAPATGAACAASSAGSEIVVEGVRVRLDAHGVIGQPKSYRRVQINECPWHKAPGTRCFQRHLRRNFDTKESRDSGLGDNEPYAFIGAWIRAGQGMTPEQHGAYRPSRADVLAYGQEFGWRPL